MDGLTVDELTLEDKMAWRKKIRSVDASLHSVLDTAAAQEKGRLPLLSRKKPDDATDETPPKRGSKGLHLGFHSATS